MRHEDRLAIIDQALFGAAMIDHAAIFAGQPWRSWASWLAAAIIVRELAWSGGDVRTIKIDDRIDAAMARAMECCRSITHATARLCGSGRSA